MLRHDRIKDFTPKEAMLNLFRIAEQLKPIISDEPQYAPLIRYIYNSKKKERPTLKRVSQETGINIHTLGKQLRELYFFVLEKENVLKFDKVEYNLHYRLDWKYYNLKLNNLSVVPNVGDTFESYFLEGIIGMGTFTVERIWHSLEGDKQVVDIDLGDYVSPQKI